MDITEKIRTVRETKEWSQEDMANKLNMSLSGYAKVERGDTRLNLPKLQKIADLFDMDLIELLSVNSKGDVYLANDNFQVYNYQLNNNYGETTQTLIHKIEKLEQALTHKDELLIQKDKLIAQKDAELSALKKLLEAYQKV